MPSDITYHPDQQILYQKAASDPKDIISYDADYPLNAAALSDRTDWLGTKLSLPPAP